MIGSTFDSEKGCLKFKRIIHNSVLSALNVQKDYWKFINLHQILFIENFEIMKHIEKKKLKFQIIVFFFMLVQMYKGTICKHCPHAPWFLILCLHLINTNFGHEFYTFLDEFSRYH
jgi:hypothetical protein